MKKIFSIILLLMVAFPTCTAKASTEQVRDYLRNYGADDDTFYVEEYENNVLGQKDLFIRIFEKQEDIQKNEENTIYSEQNKILAEMAKTDWFDDGTIYCIVFCDTMGMMRYNQYYVDRGVSSWSDGTLHPWIINTENDLPQEKILFLGRVAQELLQYNIGGGVNLAIGSGGENNLSIEECSGIAIVRGSCEYLGNSYDFVTEFTYESESEWNGTYDTVYVGANNIDLYGEYTPMEGMEVK